MKRPIQDVIGATVASVLGGVILAALALIAPLRDIAISAVVKGVTWIWNTITASYSIPGWVIMFAALFTVAQVRRWIVAVASKEDPAYLSYNEDSIEGAKWRWSWKSGGIARLCGFCPTCDSELVACKNNMGRCTDFVCGRCERYSTKDSRQIKVVVRSSR